MSNSVLIIGESGAGKSTAIRTLNPKETFIINVLGKPLPFKAFKKMYTPISGWDDKKGNYFSTDDSSRIIRCIKMVNEDRPDITNLIVDDFQYVMCNEFMRRSQEIGYQKFSDIGKNAWSIINELTQTRSTLFSFVLSHSDSDQTGYMRFKSIGKMLDDKVKIEGMFSIVLHALATDGDFKFLTQNNGTHLAKSPLEMFEGRYIENDLDFVKQSIISYEGE